MKTLIVYASQTGFTKKYAEWIAERTGCECIKTDDADIRKVQKYDVIILGGGIYASRIAGISFLKKNISKLKAKKIIVFFSCASPYEKEGYDTVVNFNLKGELEGIPCFYTRGTFDMKEMTFKDRTLCKMLRKMVAKKNPEDYAVWEKGLMEVGEDERGDWVDKSYIEPIIEAVQ